MDRIIVEHRSVPNTRTKERPSAWRAECWVGGKTYAETSRSGATHELARTLKNAGFPDAEFEVHENGRPGYLLVPSFHAWAEWGYEGDRRVSYAKILATRERLRSE